MDPPAQLAVANDPEPPPREDRVTARAREHLANERTVLAWTRTAITFMGLGFVVARFGIFLRQIETGPHPGTHYSGIIGIGLVVAGLSTAAISVVRFFRAREQIDAGQFQAEYWPEVSLAAMTGAIGIALIVYLVANV